MWASEARSEATARRATGFEDVGTADALAARSDVILSICPPHAAREVAGSVAGFEGIYVDANAIAPATARDVLGASSAASTGASSAAPRSPRLYLSGPDAPEVARLFEGTGADAVVVSAEIGDGIRGQGHLRRVVEGNRCDAPGHPRARTGGGRRGGSARRVGGFDSGAATRIESARRSAEAKGWRWVGEMEEIADAFAAHDLPDGFHRAAAEVYRWRQGVRS